MLQIKKKGSCITEKANKEEPIMLVSEYLELYNMAYLATYKTKQYILFEHQIVEPMIEAYCLWELFTW